MDVPENAAVPHMDNFGPWLTSDTQSEVRIMRKNPNTGWLFVKSDAKVAFLRAFNEQLL